MPRWLGVILAVLVALLAGYIVYDQTRPERQALFELETPEGEIRLEVPDNGG